MDSFRYIFLNVPFELKIETSWISKLQPISLAAGNRNNTLALLFLAQGALSTHEIQLLKFSCFTNYMTKRWYLVLSNFSYFVKKNNCLSDTKMYCSIQVIQQLINNESYPWKSRLRRAHFENKHL